MISETKIDDTCSIENSVKDSFSTPFRSDCDANCGGIILNGREEISNLFAIEDAPVQELYVKLNLLNTKWLINCS